ncbi:MAG: hypothetical protein IH605_00295 [Burkholderiales bacterium]|nr:hypothetical protein [Burkholderiales bacterium]
MKPDRKLIQIIGAIALASHATTGAYAQMGGGGMMGSGGMMGGFGAGGGNGRGTMGGDGMGSRDDNGYEPGSDGARRYAPLFPNANGPELSDELDLGPLNQLDLSRRQLGEINIIREELKDRQWNARRRLKAEHEALRELYDSPKRDQAKIDAQFHRIEQLRREMLESSVKAQDQIAAQLNPQQRQRLQRIAPRWSAGR